MLLAMTKRHMLKKNKKLISAILLFFIIGGFAIGALPQPAKAQWITMDVPSLSGWIGDKLTKVWEKITWNLLGTAFKKSLSTFLNKLAYDSAVYVASAGSGQKSLVNLFKKNYLPDLVDAVGGEFIDELATKSGFASALGTTSLCEPVDLTMKANLLMSFKKPKEPPTPKCSITKIRQAAKKSAQDDLLEFNAGYQESEGGLNITLFGIKDDQIFNGTDAQDELTSIAKDFEVWFKELDGIMKQLQGGLIVSSVSGSTTGEARNNDQINATIDEHKENLKDMQDQFQRDIDILVQIGSEANSCIATYEREGAFCGNNVANGDEMCDYGGNPFCTSSCKLATSTCTAGAPDGVKDSSEVCDTTVPPTAICELLGYAPGGSVTCNSDCYLDISLFTKNKT